MGYWTNLGLKALETAVDTAIDTGLHELNKLLHKGELKFVAPTAYKYAYAFWAQREAYVAGMNYAKNYIRNQYSRKREAQGQEALKQKLESRKWIIENYKTSAPNTSGKITLQSAKGDGATMEVGATDAMGRVVREALFISYEDTDNKNGYEVKKNSQSTGFFTSTVYCYDLIPSISFESNKNIVQTQVQGRDFSRKELISGGDLTFSVSGNLVSHQVIRNDDTGGITAEYPENSVQKFVQIMQHPGIIKVNHFLFKQLGVDRVIVKSFSLGAPTRINMQPYQFTCVAIEPDEETIVKQDTIYEIDRQIAQSDKQGWWSMIAKKKAEQYYERAINEASSYAQYRFNKLEDYISSL